MAGLTGLTTAIISGPDDKELAIASLSAIDEEGTLDDASLSAIDFQFFPESVQDSIEVSYVDKEIPGLSHPLKQWVSNGGRTISFEAVFSADIRLLSDLTFAQKLVVYRNSPENAVWNNDIRYSIARLRSYCYPGYAESDGVTVSHPPPIAKLLLPGMGLGTAGVDEVYTVMTSCNVNYMRLFPSGIPRLVRVELEFAEIIQIGGLVVPVSANDMIAAGLASFLDNYGA